MSAGVLPNGNSSDPMDVRHPMDVRCSATARSGNQCRNNRVKGATVCEMHGGKAPQVQRKAAERLAEARDASLAFYLRQVEDGKLDAKVALDAIVRLTEVTETLEGRVAKRTESVTPTAQDLTQLEDELAARRQAS